MEKVAARFDNIDFLRATAITAVVAFHFLSPRQELTTLPPMHFGRLGVHLFFIVSGFCIWMTASRCPDLATFWTKRLGRIQPCYMAAAILSFTTLFLFGLNEIDVQVTDLLGALTWATLFYRFTTIDGAYWSLMVELKFYLVFGLLVFALGRWISPINSFCVLTMIAIGVLLVAKIDGTTESLSHVGLLPYAAFFLAGIAIYEWDSLSTLQLSFFAAVCVAAILLGFGDLHSRIFMIARWKTMRIPAPIRFIGLISYPLYLVHSEIGHIVIRRSATWVQWDAARVGMAVAVSMALAVALHFAIENRARRPFERLVLTPLGTILRPVSAVKLSSQDDLEPLQEAVANPPSDSSQSGRPSCGA